MSFNSCESSDNLTTDAVPDAPRRTISIPLEENNVDKSNNKINSESPKEEKSLPKVSTTKKPTCKESKPKKSSKNTNAGTKIYVVNSSGVHFGAVNNFNYCASNENVNKQSRSDDNVVRTEEINRILSSRSTVNREHINIISTHLGAGWRDVGLDLGYTPGQLDNFYEDNKAAGNKEVVYQMLLDWTQLKADEATLGDLTTTLWHLGQRTVIQKLIS